MVYEVGNFILFLSNVKVIRAGQRGALAGVVWTDWICLFLFLTAIVQMIADNRMKAGVVGFRPNPQRKADSASQENEITNAPMLMTFRMIRSILLFFQLWRLG